MSLLIFLLLIINLNGIRTELRQRTCEPIRVDLCKYLGYNMTEMPNLGGNDLQQDAEYTLKSFTPLIQYGCSSNLKLFLCSVYVPMCTEKVSNPIGPCRNLCESVRSRCYPVLRGFGFPWPDALNCSRFPIENNQEHMCMEGPKEIDIRAPVDPAILKKIKFTDNYDKDTDDIDGNNEEFTKNCPGQYRIFDEDEQNFAEIWVTMWAMICFIISLLSLLTLIIGGGRIRARPLISLALCYCMISAGWGLRIFSGRISTCVSSITPGDVQEDGLSNVNCAFVFLMIYYFGMAANAWWVCLCGWWVARVGLLWPPEKLRNLNSILHVCGWGLPAAQTVAALVRRDVDSDQLTGTCYVGSHNSTTLLGLVLIPQFIYLIIGVILLIIGCLYAMKKTSQQHQQPPQPVAIPLTASTPPPRKDNDFLGGICAFYIVPIFCVMATTFYEYNNRDDWLKNIDNKPILWPFLLRHLMSLFIGISSLFWIWSMKTVIAWRSVLRRLGPRKQLPIKVQTLPVLRYVPPPLPPTTTTGTTSALLPPTTTTTQSQQLNVQNNLINSGRISSASTSSHRSHSHRKPRSIHHLRVGGETII